MESQQQRRRKQEKPRHLNNNQDGDEVVEAHPPADLREDRTRDLSPSKEDNFLCKSCHVRMPTRSEFDSHLSSCHQHQNIVPQVSWEEFQSQNRPPVINLMKKKFSFVQSNSCSDNSKSEDDQCNEMDGTPLTRSPQNSETREKEASDVKKMRMSEQDDESDDGHPTPHRSIFFKNPSMNLHQLNMLLLQLQQHQIMLWQVLDAIRKKVVEDKMPPNSEVFSDLTSLFLRHQKEIAHISASYQLAVGFLGRGDLCKTQDSQYLHYQNLYNSLRFKQNIQAEDIRNGAQNLEKIEISQPQLSADVSPPHVDRQDKANDDDDDDDDDEEDTIEGEDPLKCSVCGDSFTSKDNLKIHFQQHLEQNLDKIHAETQPSKSTIGEEVEENQNSMRGEHPLEEEQNEMKNKFSDSNSFAERLTGVQYICPDGSKNCKLQETSKIFSQTSSSEQMSVIARREVPYDGMNNGSSFKGKDFKSPLVALSSMSSALNFTKTPMSLIFPGEGSNSSQAYQSFRYNTPTSLMKSAILAPNGHDDPLEQYMEIQVTENSKMEELIKEGESKVSDPNECAICHRVLSCRSALQMHYRTHTGERPYKCKLCSRTFTTKGNLKTHMSVHRGKPLQRQLHKCPICSREFSNPLVLQQHFRSHTSDPQKAFSSIFPGMIPGMFMPPINPFFSYPINPNPYFNPLFSSQFAAKNLPNISKVFQEQRTSPKKLIETPINKLPANSGIHENQMVKESSEVERKRERRVQEANDGMEASRPGNGKFEDISDKSSDESDIEADDRKEQNAIFQNEEARKSSYNTAIKLEENHVSSELNLPYMSPLVALADRVNALSHHYALPEGQRHQREGSLPMDAPRHIPEDFNKSLLLRTPTSLNASNSFLSSPLFIKATESQSGPSDPHPNATIGSKASAACPICGKMFSCKSAVDIHMRSHTKERPFRCEYCDRAFTTKGNLKQHVGTNHHVVTRVSEQTNQQTGVRIANWMSDSSSSKSASPFNISGAIASTNTTSSPKVKQELSGGDNQSDPKPKEQGNSSHEPIKQNPNGARYFCTICEKPFSSTSALQIHSRTHTGDRPFVCPTCNKAFTTKGNLKVHMGTHAWNKVPSRRGRRMSVEPLGPQFNAALGKDQIMNPSIMASFHQKMNCSDRFPYSFMGLPTPSLFQSKLPEHHLPQGFHGKLPLMASLQGQSLCYPSYAGNYDIVKSPTAKSILPQEVTVKTEKVDNETELDLSIKKPSPPVSSTPSKPLMLLREGSDWSNDVKPHHLALNCR